jgi:hypothetical protein
LSFFLLFLFREFFFSSSLLFSFPFLCVEALFFNFRRDFLKILFFVSLNVEYYFSLIFFDFLCFPFFFLFLFFAANEAFRQSEVHRLYWRTGSEWLYREWVAWLTSVSSWAGHRAAHRCRRRRRCSHEARTDPRLAPAPTAAAAATATATPLPTTTTTAAAATAAAAARCCPSP